MRIATAGSAIALAVACLGLGTAGTAQASAGSAAAPAAAVASCSTHRVDAYTAGGWCSADHRGQWRLGVQCARTKAHHYTNYSERNGQRYASCPRREGKGIGRASWRDRE